MTVPVPGSGRPQPARIPARFRAATSPGALFVDHRREEHLDKWHRIGYLDGWHNVRTRTPFDSDEVEAYSNAWHSGRYDCVKQFEAGPGPLGHGRDG